MRAKLMLSLTGMSIVAHDPLTVGIALETHLDLALSFLGISGLALLTLWSERWLDPRPAPEMKDSAPSEAEGTAPAFERTNPQSPAA